MSFDKEYSSGEYLMNMKADFERIALKFEEMAKRLYKEQAKSEGKRDKLEITDVRIIPSLRWRNIIM